MPTQQPLTKIFVAWGITAGDISYIQSRRGKGNKNLTITFTQQRNVHLPTHKEEKISHLKVLSTPFFQEL